MELCKIKLEMVREKTTEYNYTITEPQKIVEFINSIENYSNALNENIIVIALNNKNNIIAYNEIAKGGINNCNIDIPSIFRVLFNTNANKFILVHNHPSGNSEPSKEDFEVTDRIKQASNIMGINFLDHIVIGDNEYTSIFSELLKKGV